MGTTATPTTAVQLTLTICDVCNGSGTKKLGLGKCPECDGTGKIVWGYCP